MIAISEERNMGFSTQQEHKWTEVILKSTASWRRNNDVLYI